MQALQEKARAASRDVTSDVVVEEVFENERFQPFRWVLLLLLLLRDELQTGIMGRCSE